jgi:molybdopterin-binding protein
VIRAEEITVAREPHPSSARNHFAGTVVEVGTSGALARVTIDVDGVQLIAALTTRSARELSIQPSASVYVSFKATAVHLC